MVQGNCTQNLDQIFAQLLFRRDHFHSCSLISLFKISYYNSNTPPPSRHNFFLLKVDHQVSEEAIHQIWSRYLKDLSRYTYLVPSSLLFDTPLPVVINPQNIAVYTGRHTALHYANATVSFFFFAFQFWGKFVPLHVLSPSYATEYYNILVALKCAAVS